MHGRRAGKPREIVMAGDSLIEYFDWQGRFPAHRVANLGISGETVEGLRSRLGRITEGRAPADMVFLMSGINNLAMEDTGFPGAYEDVIRGFSSAWSRVRIFIHSLLPTLLPWIADSAITAMNTMLRDLARRTSAGYIDVNSAFKAHGIRECLLQDGIHISPEGYALWAEALETVIGRIDRDCLLQF